MITSRGIGFLIVAILVSLLGRLTQVGWLYLMDAVLWGIFLFSAIIPWISTGFLRASRKLERASNGDGLPGPAEGDTVEIKIILRNPTLWPRYVLGLFYHCSLGEPGKRLQRFFVTELASSGRVTLTSSIEAHQRGLQKLGPVIVESAAPFGLFRRRLRSTGSETVLVYPEVCKMENFPLVNSPSTWNGQQRKSRMGIDPAGSRKYLPGDPRRLIHWRNTAKTGRPMVKEFEHPVDRTFHLLFDATQVQGVGKDTTLEYGIKIVASAADFARRARISAAVWGGRLDGSHSDRPWADLLEDLALVEPGEGSALEVNLNRLPLGSNALAAVSDEDRTGIDSLCDLASSLGQLVVVVLSKFDSPGSPRQESGPGTAGDSDDNIRLLEKAHIPVVMCRPGEIAETIKSLETLQRANNPQNSVSAMAGVS